MKAADRSVTNLPEQVEELPPEERRRFTDIFALSRGSAALVPPEEMRQWIERTFGSVDAVEQQTVIKLMNRWTLEGALFNSLRARRPISGRSSGSEAARSEQGTDPFCEPRTGTPADTFGRVQGRHSITASNVAKYDGLHSVVILDRHDPLSWDEDRVVDAFETALEWLRRAHAANPKAVYPFVMWNCLPRSGASIVHGHLQAALGESMPYARIEVWRRAAEAYREQRQRSYFDDVYEAHRSLGLGFERGQVRWYAHLTPVKEKECIALTDAVDSRFFRLVYRLLSLYRDELGVRAFNLALYLPPMAAVEEDWSGFPAALRLVDRGDPSSSTSDIGAMELFAQPVVAFDPWRLAEYLRTL